jgi:iron(III) transport system ATP-binding protein
MRRGQIVQVGSPAEVYRNPISPEIAISTGDVLVLDAAQSSTGEFSFALNQKPKSANSVLGKVIIRPEEINLSQNLDSGVLAKVIKIDYYGHDAMVHLRLIQDSDQVIDVRVSAPVELQVGELVGLDHVGPVRWIPNAQK